MRKIRENKKGFTLAELLIVVAIIAVLVAVSIPIFTAQLKKARLATNQANARAAYAATVAKLLDEGKSTGNATYDVAKGAISGNVGSTTSGGSISKAPGDWTVSSPVATLSEKTATKWQVFVSESGVTYKATFPTD